MAEISYNGELNCGIPVSDLDRAVEWYSRVLGFSLRQRIDQLGFAILETGVPGVVVGLDTAEAARTGTRGVALTWGVTDIDAAREALAAAGVETEPVREIPGVVRLLDFTDPDGNRHTFWADPKD
jgi:predicted enzyme related to lactoylglutathione lyase